jgi:hypothetical protein
MVTTPGMPTRWPTPRLLRAHLYAIYALSALLLLVGEGTLARARATLKTIGKEAAPSIVAAQEIQMHLADLDAAAATALLGARALAELDAPPAQTTSAPLPVETPAQREARAAAALRAEAAGQLFELRRGSVTRRLVDASQNISFGDTEKVPIVTVLDGLQRYVGLVADARGRTARRDLAGARDAYRLATDLLHVELLPAAQALDDANKNVMNDVYVAGARADNGAEVLAVGVGGALAFVLLLAQAFTYRRFRRLTSPPLVLATVLAASFTGYLVDKFGAAKTDLKLVKEDAFESIHLVTRARSIALDAKGDQRRWLLEDGAGSWAGSLAWRFSRSCQTLSSAPDLPASADQAISKADGGPPPFQGLLADELANADFRGEREAAVEMIRAFASFHRADLAMRKAAAREGDDRMQAARAIALGEANDAFEQFDASAQRVQLLNEDVFEKVLGEADRGLKSAEIWDPGLAVAIAALAWLGTRKRLAEYD